MLTAQQCEQILLAGANLKIEGLSPVECLRLAEAGRRA